MESQERILQLDHFCSHWSIKLPMKFFAPIMRYWDLTQISGSLRCLLQSDVNATVCTLSGSNFQEYTEQNSDKPNKITVAKCITKNLFQVPGVGARPNLNPSLSRSLPRKRDDTPQMMTSSAFQTMMDQARKNPAFLLFP